MIEASVNANHYVTGFHEHMRKLNQEAGPGFGAIRNEAFDRFASLGIPTTRMEDWRYTDVAPISRIPFRPAPAHRNGLSGSEVQEFLFGDLACHLLVFVNGHFVRDFSALQPLGEGVRVCSLREALLAAPDLALSHTARYASFERNAFVALNTSFLDDGAFIYLPRGTVLHSPVHLLYLSRKVMDEPAVSFPRTVIVAEADCSATIVESYAGLGPETYFTNSVTEISAGDNSTIRHCKLQREGSRAYHIASQYVRQGRSSAVNSNSFSLGGRLVRNDIHVLLDDEGAECTLNGLYLAGGEQHVDNHTCIDHAKPNCTSRELYKGILDGHASAVFDGRIVVRPDAQKTVARQTNKNLLLSEGASVNSKPQLEILADDVKCNHGAAIGQLDDTALFYLRSRGIDLLEARKLLIYAFGSDVINSIQLTPIQCQLDLVLLARLSEGGRSKEAV